MTKTPSDCLMQWHSLCSTPALLDGSDGNVVAQWFRGRFDRFFFYWRTCHCINYSVLTLENSRFDMTLERGDASTLKGQCFRVTSTRFGSRRGRLTVNYWMMTLFWIVAGWNDLFEKLLGDFPWTVTFETDSCFSTNHFIIHLSKIVESTPLKLWLCGKPPRLFMEIFS